MITRETLNRLRLPLLIVGALLLFFGSISSLVAPGIGLDPSWQQVLGYAREQRFILGKDILFTYGPWGWLSTSHCQPSEYWPRFIWELLLKGALAAGWFAIATRVKWWRSLVLLAFGLLALPFFADSAYVALVVGSLLWLAVTKEKRPWVGALIGAALGFLAMQKFTLFVMTGAGAGGVALCLWFRRDRALAVTLPVAWGLSVIVSWVTAQQALIELPAFILRSLAISSAYQEAMSFREKYTMFYLGLSGVIFTALTIAFITWRDKGPVLARAAFAVTCAGFGYLVWTHGFVRADGHMLGFFYATLVAALLVPRAWFLTIPLLAISLTGVYFTIPTLVQNSLLHARHHVREGFSVVIHPRARHEVFLKETAAARVVSDMPLTRSLIGNGSVDVIGYEQSVALLNQFNYRPRPIFQGYQACSPILAELNGAYYTGPNAPEFVLARMESIDERLPSLDDTHVIFLLRKHYRLIGEERGFLILQRASQPVPFLPEPAPLVKGKLGRAIDVGTAETNTAIGRQTNAPLWVSVEVRRSLLGQLRAVLYKPAEMKIRVELTNGEITTFRFNPAASAGGFLLTPHLPDTDAYKAWFTGATRADVKNFTILPGDAKRFFKSEFSYRLTPLPTP